MASKAEIGTAVNEGKNWQAKKALMGIRGHCLEDLFEREESIYLHLRTT